MLLEPIEKLDEKKLRGGYYTPQEITHFVCRWAIDDPQKSVLEPSCGDGNFIEASIQRFRELGVPETRLNGLIRGIELIPKEAQKATDRAAMAGVNSHSIVNTDFFDYFTKNPRERFGRDLHIMLTKRDNLHNTGNDSCYLTLQYIL